jgi:Leucine-rich repeat (LRR) protein
MVDLNGRLCTLPVDLRAIVLSHVAHVKTRQILALSSTFREAFSRPGALPRTFDYEGVAGDDIADHLVRVLGVDRVRSLEKERALELIGVHKNRLCEYACVRRNFEVLKWAHNELDLPWAQYPAGRVNDDVLALRMLREASSIIKQRWWVNVGPEEWSGVTIENGRVVKLELREVGLTGAMPAEIEQLTSLEMLYLGGNLLTSLPAEIGQLASLRKLGLGANKLTSLPAEIGQLRSLEMLYLGGNLLTSLPAEIGQIISLDLLFVSGNQLTSVPAEIGLLTSLDTLDLGGNQLTSVPAAIRELRAAGCDMYLDDGVTVDE